MNTSLPLKNCSQQNNELLVTDAHTTVKERQRVNICKPFYTFCLIADHIGITRYIQINVNS